MKIANETLISDLIERTRQVMNRAAVLREHELDALNKKASADSWSALECVEHLNRYGDYYLPEITMRLQTAAQPKSKVFISSWLGNYFAQSMLPKENLNTMKTFEDKDPNGSILDIGTIDKFVDQQKQMLELLNQIRHVDLIRTKTSITISKWIKLRLGDTLRVIIYHNQRHLLQAEKALGISTMASHDHAA